MTAWMDTKEGSLSDDVWKLFFFHFFDRQDESRGLGTNGALKEIRLDSK